MIDYKTLEESYTELNEVGLLRLIAVQNDLIISLLQCIEGNTEKRPVGRPKKED